MAPPLWPPHQTHDSHTIYFSKTENTEEKWLSCTRTHTHTHTTHVIAHIYCIMFETYPDATSPCRSRGARSHAVSRARWPNIAELIHTTMQLLLWGLNGSRHKETLLPTCIKFVGSIKLDPSHLRRERRQTSTSSRDRNGHYSSRAIRGHNAGFSIEHAQYPYTSYIVINYIIFCHDVMLFVNKWKHNHGTTKTASLLAMRLSYDCEFWYVNRTTTCLLTAKRIFLNYKNCLS